MIRRGSRIAILEPLKGGSRIVLLSLSLYIYIYITQLKRNLFLFKLNRNFLNFLVSAK